MRTLYDVGQAAREAGTPLRYDDDLVCNKCGEPWDAWGARNGDMNANEYRRFRNGKGCPTCNGPDWDA